MLICPQCQLENPNTNKFCQGCGTSLTSKVCAECGTNVELSEKRCPNCGTETGTVWWAIISEAREYKEQGENSPLTTHPSLPVGAYLDQQQRYQLLEPLIFAAESTVNAEAQVRVLDCQPFQLSLLEATSVNAVIGMDIPAIAKTYIALKSNYSQVPAIHDAWQQGQQVVLVADRSDWQELNKLWHDEKTTPLQILHWLYDTVQLWAALEPWHCRQSLLELSNLRVDEDGKVGLQRLYPEPEAGKALTVQDLGQVWQRLFQESQRTKFGSLVELLADLQAGNVQTTDDLRSRLKAIAQEFQTDFTSTSDLQPVSLPAGGSEAIAVTLNNSATPTSQMNEPQDSLMRSDELPTLVLPLQLVSLEDAGCTDVGSQRHHNEDFFGIETAIHRLEFPNSQAIQARGLYILCDGMGGHAGGEVASTLAVKTLQQYFQTHWQTHQLPTKESIREAVLLANQAIYDLNQQDGRSGVGRMGTTLVLVLLQNTQVAVAHVGDSRLYRLSRKQGLEQVTLDHEVGQREILRGVEPAIAYSRPDAYQLTQALGPRDENFVNPDVQFLELSEDTLLILVSDGLSDNDLIEHHWHTHLEPLLTSEASLQHGVSRLIDLANQYNGHDNITAVLVRAKVSPKPEQ
ncbi:serine/threonine phosphatase [Chroococcidiopsis sp. CCMEE 29]|uniref:serine/threonine phosphatase n=1 Tax=Chroococcidiopsis sp. CCMEE 29 TaxID=155894 RepID=UPI002021FADA|nr:serine/threonine phosphatase [Chroococcidiopsis sp. CCMEE 29]